MISVNILLRECYRNIGKIDKIDEIEPSNILNLLNILNLSPSDKHGEIGGKAAKDNRPSTSSMLASSLLSTSPTEADAVSIMVIMRHAFQPPDNASFTRGEKAGYSKQGQTEGETLFSSRFTSKRRPIRPFHSQKQANTTYSIPFVLEAL